MSKVDKNMLESLQTSVAKVKMVVDETAPAGMRNSVPLRSPCTSAEVEIALERSR